MFTSGDTAFDAHLIGRCYCGHLRVSARKAPQITSYCHCTDCRRLSGAPVTAFSAFGPKDIDITPAPRAMQGCGAGVSRWMCPACGTAVAAQYAYLPDQLYVPVGLWDDAQGLKPAMHSHADSALSWLHLDDNLPRHNASARTALTEGGGHE